MHGQQNIKKIDILVSLCYSTLNVTLRLLGITVVAVEKQ